MNTKLLDIERKYRDGEIVGFIPDPQYEAMLAKPQFMTAAPAVMDLPDKDTFQYRYLLKALAKHFKDPNFKLFPQHQLDGTCGGQASKQAKDTLAAIFSLVYGTPFSGPFSVAAEYGGARVESGRSPGTWQGVSMGWLAGWTTKFGGVPMKDVPVDEKALREDELIALQWAKSRDGVPAVQQAKALNFLVEEAPLIKSAREAAKLIQNGGTFINGCSFVPTGKRDSRGFSKIQRIQGGHATFWSSVRYDPFGLLYVQSWGPDWGSGPVWPNDCPPWAVWLSEEDADTMIQSSGSESYGYVTKGGLTPLLLQ